MKLWRRKETCGGGKVKKDPKNKILVFTDDGENVEWVKVPKTTDFKENPSKIFYKITLAQRNTSIAKGLLDADSTIYLKPENGRINCYVNHLYFGVLYHKELYLYMKANECIECGLVKSTSFTSIEEGTKIKSFNESEDTVIIEISGTEVESKVV